MNNSKNFLMDMIQNEISSMSGAGTPHLKGDVEGQSDERELRTIIRELCRNIIHKTKPVNESLELRHIVRKLIIEAKKEVENAPHSSTAINLLEELLKQILPGVEIDFKTLTTSTEQRDSFRANLLDAVSKLLSAEDVNLHAGVESELDIPLEEVEVKVDDEEEGSTEVEPEDMFIDINDDGEIPEEEESKFGIEGQEETGRNMAAKTYDNIEKNIVDSYAILSDDTDRKTFRDYLITNIKMYFDKYESELSTQVTEPTTDEYEKEKEDQSLATGGEEDLGMGTGEEEFDFDI